MAEAKRWLLCLWIAVYSELASMLDSSGSTFASTPGATPLSFPMLCSPADESFSQSPPQQQQ
eukprot:COSAG05_NODE_9469_length_622_cov_0.755258_1_plen_61_part_10